MYVSNIANAHTLRATRHCELHRPRIPRNGNASQSPTLYFRGRYFASSPRPILLKPSYYLGLECESHKFFRIKSYLSNKSRPSAFEGKRLAERAIKKRHVNSTATKMAFPLTEDRLPQKRKAKVFGTFSQKVHTPPEVEWGAYYMWLGKLTQGRREGRCNMDGV